MRQMRLCAVSLALALIGVHPASAASTFVEAAEQLDGDWRGGNFVLRVDARRAQASVDPRHPFEWMHFLIKEVTADEIVFSVGPELYEGKLDADTLTLKSTSFRGARVLFRDTQLRGTSE